MHCNNCPRTAAWRLKLTFYQHNRQDGSARFGLTFEAEGGWCDFHKTRHTKRKWGEAQNFELCGPGTRQEISTLFALRGWGEPAWQDTQLDWLEVGKEDTTKVVTLKT